ncbi:hypothetical protein TNCV_617891 [Trichonephila clavipes]|nr:hypothetical protein TNCV_617891 [Trichonephila clavipes]
MITHVCGNDTLLRKQAFELHRCFRECREIVQDDERSGRLQTVHTAENIETVSEEVHKHRLQTIKQIAELVGKIVLEVFIEIQDIGHLEFIPERRTGNKELYIDNLLLMRECIRKKGPKMWAEKSWVFLYDNDSVHRSLLINDFLVNTKTTVLPQLPYLPYLTPCGFSLFPEMIFLFLCR